MQKLKLQLQLKNYFLPAFLIFIFCILSLSPQSILAYSTANFQIEVFYAKETHQIDTTQPFTETLLNPNGSSFDIDLPAYALTSGEAVNLTMYSTPEESVTTNKPLPSGKLGADIFYNISFKKVSDNSTVSFFDKAITLTFNYIDSDISGINESTLTVYRWNGSVWTALSDSAVDTGLNKVTATSQQFNDFALLGNASPFCGDGSCNGSETCSSCPADCGDCLSNGGGGGPGGGLITPATSVTFSGRAYPLSRVTVLKDGQIVITTIAGPDANFKISLTGLSSGNYIFSVYGKDDALRRSTLFTFPIFITKNATTNISGIFISPTIDVDKSEVKRGDNIAIFGQSAPSSEITIAVNSEEELFVKTDSDKNGVYLYNLDTSPLVMEQHFTKSKSALNGELSSFSQLVSFMVGTKNVAKTAQTFLKGDLNGDGRVNLIDFSIAAYWYKRSSPPAYVDINSDGKIDLIDFSIMASYWTG